MSIPDKDKRIKNSLEMGNKMYNNQFPKIVDGIKELDSTFAEFIQEIPYGSVFPRKELDLKYRQIASITVLTQLNLKPQLKSHLIAGLNSGLTKEEIKELFLHLAQFIGYPLAMEGLKVLKEIKK